MNASELIAARALQLSAEGQFDAEIPSPCISVCRMTPDRSHCEGCFRTLAEIAEWSRASSERRRAIWSHLLQRAQGANA
jgi:predicted Fe-S protein YdhL (DUF1289 family)